ncbi:hypothetical protein [Arhodomonas sp. AD133]|uniref:hypothetical protein n=1 Tax=Arhodomonas sp. AD133 TaxID=3415009 RepID=UPI003EC08AAC
MTATRKYVVFFVALLVASVVGIAAAQPTEVTVRVLSRGGGFLGAPAGGAEVTLRDARTGELLARGMTEGSPGDIERIMGAASGRDGRIATEETARFSTSLDLQRPRLVEVTAIGPMGEEQAANRATATQWIVPGHHLTGGDGWVIEIPGLAVAIDSAPTALTLNDEPAGVDVRASITMMCGCPIEPGGRWDADDFHLAVLVYRDGERLREQPLSYAGEPSRFGTRVEVTEPGAYELVVYAHQPDTGNTGVDRVAFVAESDQAALDPVAAAMARCGMKSTQAADDGTGAVAADGL